MMKKLSLSDITFIQDGKIDSYDLRLFLEKCGFSLFQSSNDRKVNKELVFNDQGILKLYNLIEMKRWVTNALESMEEDTTEVVRAWVKFNNTKLQHEVIDHLSVYSSSNYPDTKPLELFNDNQTECYLKFKNGVVKITKDQQELVSFSELDGAVWESSIIPRDYGDIKNGQLPHIHGKNLFQEFVEKSVLFKDGSIESDDWRDQYQPNGETEETLLSLRTGIGYLVHGYNNPSHSKAVFFVDKGSNLGRPEGGNGKSLIMDSLRHILKQSTQDGKKYRDNPNTGGRFQFSNVSLDTKMIFIDDLRDDFKIETLFSMITGDIEVERKGENKFVIPKDDKPKIGLTTNYVLMGNGTSVTRRMHLVEFGDYWNRCIKEGLEPADLLGKQLFGDDFTQDDWNDFYTFIIDCVKDYLKYGLVQPSSNSYFLKTLKQKIEGRNGDGVVTGYLDIWISNNLNTKVTEDDLFNDFRNEFPFMDGWDNNRLYDAVFTYAMEHPDYDFNSHLKKNGDTKTDRRWRTSSASGQKRLIKITRTNPLSLVA